MSYVLKLSSLTSYTNGNIKSWLAIDDLKGDPCFEDANAYNDSIPDFSELFTDINSGINIPNIAGSGLEVKRAIPEISCIYTVDEKSFEFSALRDNDNFLILTGNGSWEHFAQYYASDAISFINKIWAGASTVPETFNISGIIPGDSTDVFDWNTSSTNDIVRSAFKITEDSAISVPSAEIEFINGVPKIIYVIGPLGLGTNTGGAEVEVLNTDGVLSYTLLSQKFINSVNYLDLSWNDLTSSNTNVGSFTQAMGDFIFMLP